MNRSSRLFAAWAALVLALLWSGAAGAQTIRVGGNAQTDLTAALTTLGETFNTESAWVSPNAADVIIQGWNGGATSPLDYNAHLNAGRHVLIVGGDSRDFYSTWLRGYLNTDNPTSWDIANCTPDWNRTQAHPIVQFLPTSYEFPQQFNSNRMARLSTAQPANTTLLGRRCDSTTQYVLATRRFNNGGTFTYMGLLVGISNTPVSQTEFVQPFLRGYLDFIRNGVNQAPVVTSPGNQSHAEDQAVSVQITASDPNGDNLSYSAANLPPGLSINPTTGLISGRPSFTAAANSPYSVTVTVSDGQASAMTSFSWTITNTNRPPTLTSPGNQSSAEGATISLQPVAADPDGDALQWSSTGLPMGLSINPTTGLITGTITFTAAANSPYSVTITVRDAQATASVNLSWTVTNTNRPPTVTSPGNQASAEGAAINRPIAASDPDGDALSYSAANLPQGLDIDGATGVISGTIGFDAAANSPYSVTVTASDGQASAMTSFSWTVTNTNRAPAFTNLGDQSHAEGEVIDVALTAVDPDGDAVLFNATGLPPGLMLNPMTGRVTGTVDFNASDNSPYAVMVTATDGALTTNGAFMWLIGDTNRAPAVTNPNAQTNAENDSVSLQIVANDPDMDRLTFLAQGLPPGLTLDPITGQITGTLPFTAAGAYAVTVSVSDGNLISRVAFTWTVTNVNRAPVITSPGNQSGAEGATINLAIVASDADMDALAWTATGLPPGLSINASTGRVTGTLSFDAAANSPYSVAVTVTDGEASAMTSFSWAVTNTNRAPALNSPGSQTSAENQTVSLQILGNDPDGDALAWTAMGLPTGLMINPMTGSITGTLGFDAAANSPYNVTVRASDGALSSPVSFTWVVTNTNRPPVITLIEDQVNTEGEVIGLQVMAADPDGNNVTYSAAGLPGGLSINAATGRITGTLTFTSGEFSPYDVTVFATDGIGVSSQPFVWTVNEQNRPPTVSAGGPYSVNEGASVTLRATGADLDGNSLSYSWDLDNDGDCDDAMAQEVAFVGVDGPAAPLVTACVSDGQATARATATVTVRNLNPTVTASSAPMAPNESQVVTFQAMGSDPAGANDPLTFTWSFGDNTASATGASVTHTYADNGTYTVTVTATDGDGGSATTSLTVTVGDQAPTLSAITGPMIVDEGSEGTWQTTIGKASADSVLWTFAWGDGTPNNSGTYAANTTSAVIPRAHTYADNGTFTLNITARDDDGQTATASLAVTVNNVAPTITTFEGDTMGLEGQTLSFRGAATDPGADTLSWTWTFGDGSQPAMGAQVTHVFRDAGTYTVTGRVADEDGGVATRTLTVTIGNAAPVISALTGDTTGLEGQTRSFQGAASDAGGDALTWTWDFGDGSMPVSGVDRNNVTYAWRDNGAYTLTLTVSDGVASASRTLMITVNNANPVIQSAAVPSTGNEGQSLAFAVTATDVPADTLSYSWDFGDGSMPQSGRSLNHTFADDGAYFVQVTVSDEDGGRATRVFSVNIANVAPQIVDLSGDFSGDEGQTFDYAATVNDPGDDSLSYTWSFGDGSMPQTGEDLDSVSHVYRSSGVFTLTLTVVDEDGGRAQVTRTVNVGGQAPTIDTLDGDTEGDEGQALTFTASASDPGNDAITYRWDFGDGTPPVSAIDLDEVQHTFAEDGTYTVTLTARDADGESSATLTVTIQNVAPTITNAVAPMTGAEGQLLAFEATATDPGAANDPLTFSWSWGDGTDPATRPSSTHRYTNEGTYTVTLTVTDDEGASATRSFQVEIRNVQPSIVRLLGPSTGAEAQQLTFQALANDPGDDALIYTWSFGDGSPSASGEDLTEVNHAWPDNGTYTLTLRVSDGVAETSRTLSLQINNLAPMITALDGDTMGVESDTFDFTAAAVDAAGPNDPLTWAWDFGDGSPVEMGRDLTARSHVYRDAGNYTVTLTVTDDDNGRTTRALNVQVGNAAPVITALDGPAAGDEGATFTYTAAATDAGNDALTYSWNFGDGAPVEMGRDLTMVNHVYRDNGAYTLTLGVSDGTANVTRTLRVTVNNVAPTLTQVNVPNMAREGAMVSLSAAATDPAGASDPLTFSWSFGDGTPAATGPSVSHTWADDGTFQVTVTVTDGDGGMATRAVPIQIGNAAPEVLVFDGPDQAREGSPATFSVVARDVSTDTLSYRWTFEGGPTLTDVTTATHTWPDDGAYTVTLVVSDEDGGMTTVTREVTVSNVNPSILSLTGDFSGAESQPLSFSAEAADPGADTLTWEWSFGDGSQPARGQDLSMVTHAYEVAGVYTLRLTVSDDDGGQVSITRTVNINTAGPSIQALVVPGRANEGDTVTFSVQATDPTAQTLTYAWDFGDGSPARSGEGLSSLTHTWADNGSFFLTVTVTDPDGLEASAGQRVEVANVAPVITAFEPGIFLENTPGMATALATDPGRDDLTYTWSWGDGAQDSDVDLTEVTHTYASNGAYTLTLRVTDGDGGVATRAVQLTIADQAPVITEVTGDTEGDEGQTFRFEAQGVDPADDPLTWTWQLDDGDPVSTGRNNTFQLAIPEDGVYTLTVTAADPEGQLASQAVEVTVRNLAPTVSPIAGLRQGVEGQSLGFFSTASDPAGDNDPLTWTWDFGDGSPPESGMDLFSASHTFTDDGTFTVTLTVTDDEGASASQTLTVTITNAAPVIASILGPVSGAEGEELAWRVDASDPGMDTLTWAWDFGDGSMPAEGAQVQHVYADNGAYTLTLTVSDEDGGVTTRTLAVEIRNVAPSIVSEPPLLALLNRAWRYAMQVTDPGDDALTYTLLEGPEGMAFTDNTLAWEPTLAQIEGGPWLVRVEVCDDDGACATQTWEIRTDFIDEDGDGVPDDCELASGLDPADPNDGDADNDQDGINNRDECLNGTDPTLFNGPTAPTLSRPTVGARVDTLSPELAVLNATDPDGDALLYTFEVYSDEALTTLVATATALPEAPGTTAWTVEGALADNAWHWWRARAADPFVSGPWSEVGSFLNDLENDPPTAPSPQSPLGAAASVSPDLILDPATDPEGDAITYLYEVYSDADLTALVTSGESPETRWAVDMALQEDTDYWWRAGARDALGAQSPWSDALAFRVNVNNRLPAAPKVITPEEGALVDASPVPITWEQALDEDGDALTYELEVADNPDFTAPAFAQVEIPMGEEPSITVEVPDLAEDAQHWLRVRAMDPYGAGPYTVVSFIVNAQPTAPSAPTLISPIDEARVAGPAVALVFAEADDLEGDALTYEVRVFSDAGLTNEVWKAQDVANNTDSAQVTLEADLPNAGMYWWTARATDATGLTGPDAAPEPFTVTIAVNEPPTAPALVSPINGLIVDIVPGFDLVWDNASDPEGEALTYNVEIFADEALATPIWSRQDVAEGADGQTTLRVDDLSTEAIDLWWRVTATDAAGNQGASSSPGQFTRSVVIAGAIQGQTCACSTPAQPARAPWALLPLALLGALALLRRK